MSMVLGLFLEHSCPKPQEGLFSEGLSLALISDFFVFLALALEPCILDTNSAPEEAGIHIGPTKRSRTDPDPTRRDPGPSRILSLLNFEIHIPGSASMHLHFVHFDEYFD